jgi:hypothetical protein
MASGNSRARSRVASHSVSMEFHVDVVDDETLEIAPEVDVAPVAVDDLQPADLAIADLEPGEVAQVDPGTAELVTPGIVSSHRSSFLQSSRRRQFSRPRLGSRRRMRHRWILGSDHGALVWKTLTVPRARLET